MKKKHVSARLIALALIASLALSACNRLTYVDSQSSETVSAHTPANNSSEGAETPVSEPEETTEKSQATEESRVTTGEEISEVSAAISEELIPTSPSTLTPIIELGIGSGDYEIGFDTDDYGFEIGPSSFYVRGSEVMVCDPLNRRLLLYRDGVIVDEIDVSNWAENRNILHCIFDDRYFYVVESFSGEVLVINRTTNERIERSLANGDKTDPYTIYSFLTADSEIYLEKQISGSSITEASKEHLCYDKGIFQAVESPIQAAIKTEGKAQSLVINNKDVKLELSPDADKITLLGKAKSNTYITYSYFMENDTKDINGYGVWYYVFYLYNANGKLTGRYLWKDCSVLNDIDRFCFRICEDGELYVVSHNINLNDEKNGKWGIYRVNFGMDEPFPEERKHKYNYMAASDTPNVSVNSSILNSSIINESGETIPHPNLSRANAEDMAKSIINLSWVLKSENKTRPSDCTCTLDIPPHIKNAAVGTRITGIPYSVYGFDGIARFSSGINNNKVAGNIAQLICEHSVGLDCSGFASHVYGYNEKYDAIKYRNAGINIGYFYDYPDLNNVLQPMDLIVQMEGANEGAGNRHVVIFIEEDDDDIIHYYHCTRHYGMDGDQNKAVTGRMTRQKWASMTTQITLHRMWVCEDTIVNTGDYSNHYLTCSMCNKNESVPHSITHLYQTANLHSRDCDTCFYSLMENHTYGHRFAQSTATSHKSYCVCDGYTLENHTFGRVERYTSSYHKKYCDDCGYYKLESHTAEKLYSYSGSHHMKYCRFCGEEVLRESHIIQNGKCTVCGCTQFALGSIVTPEATE